MSFLVASDDSVVVRGAGQLDEPGFGFTQMLYKTAEGSLSLEQLSDSSTLITDPDGTLYLVDTSNPNLTVIEAYDRGVLLGVFGSYETSTERRIGTLDPNNRTFSGLSNVKSQPLTETTAAAPSPALTRRGLLLARKAVEAIIPTAHAAPSSDPVVQFYDQAKQQAVNAFKNNFKGWRVALTGLLGFALVVTSKSLFMKLLGGAVIVGASAQSANASTKVPPDVGAILKSFSLTIGTYAFSGATGSLFGDTCGSNYGGVSGTLRLEIVSGRLLSRLNMSWPSATPAYVDLLACDLGMASTALTIPVRTQAPNQAVYEYDSDNPAATVFPDGLFNVRIDSSTGRGSMEWNKAYDAIDGVARMSTPLVPTTWLTVDQVRTAVRDYALARM